MRICKHLLAISLGITMLAGMGCGNNSSPPPASTNAASAMMPETNGLATNLPAGGMTNSDTNTPAAPNK